MPDKHRLTRSDDRDWIGPIRSLLVVVVAATLSAFALAVAPVRIAPADHATIARVLVLATPAAQRSGAHPIGTADGVAGLLGLDR